MLLPAFGALAEELVGFERPVAEELVENAPLLEELLVLGVLSEKLVEAGSLSKEVVGLGVSSEKLLLAPETPRYGHGSHTL